MRISIVTISFNQARYLERTIRSVIEQDHTDIEYIVVDPGSTDGSRDIIQKYRSRISMVIYDPDDGPADGLNKGFSHATGDIFGFLNSDDILLPSALSYVNEYFITHSNVDVVSGHSIIIDEYDKELRKGYSEHFSLIKYAYGAIVLMQPSTFYKPELFRAVGGFNKLNKVTWDGELFVDMGMRGAKYTVTDEMLSGFRLHRESITSSSKLDKLHKAYKKYIFQKIMGRAWRKPDIIIGTLFRIMKHLSNPRALYERIARGPIYGRDAKQLKRNFSNRSK
ncbi:MAG TPA: glycosyltransferase family 2 protein [Gammaproteobacteria bacterium]|nr:glycosyltransferase family 2 protein [Gammaproteobacteria bacterium]